MIISNITGPPCDLFGFVCITKQKVHSLTTGRKRDRAATSLIFMIINIKISHLYILEINLPLKLEGQYSSGYKSLMFNST